MNLPAQIKDFDGECALNNVQKVHDSNLYDFVAYEDYALGDLVVVEMKRGYCMGVIVDTVEEKDALAPLCDLPTVVCKLETDAS